MAGGSCTVTPGTSFASTFRNRFSPRSEPESAALALGMSSSSPPMASASTVTTGLAASFSTLSLSAGCLLLLAVPVGLLCLDYERYVDEVDRLAENYHRRRHGLPERQP